MSLFNPNYYNTGVTVELRELVNSGVNVWDFEYPSYYQGKEKTSFEQKVLDHYWFRQIGQETPARWLHYFRNRVREIMPYYLQLYKSQETMEALDDPFGNVDIVETYEETTTGQSSTTDTGTANNSKNVTATHTGQNTKKISNTPQGSIANIDSYMTEATTEGDSDTDTNKETANASTSAKSTGTASGTVTHTLTKKGNQGVNTYAHDMKELRETFLNIDLMIINELNDLFLGVY